MKEEQKDFIIGRHPAMAALKRKIAILIKFLFKKD